VDVGKDNLLAVTEAAGARNSIGFMLVTGMIIGTAFTLFVVPSIYVLVAATHKVSALDEEGEPAPMPELAGAAG
jgi:multidrug efflux pump